MIHAKQTLCEYCTTVQPLIANTSSDFAELPKASAEPSHQKIEDLTQELVDLLGTALADFKFGGGGQEAYVAGILVLRCALVAAIFTEEGVFGRCSIWYHARKARAEHSPFEVLWVENPGCS